LALLRGDHATEVGTLLTVKAFASLGRSQGSRPIPPPSPEARALKGHDQGKGGKDDEREENGTQADDDLADSWNRESGNQDANDQQQPQHGFLWISFGRIRIH
jgi:hypothetical protein